MSVIFNCGFARVAVKESFRKVGSASIETDPSERWKNYLAAFEGDSREDFTYMSSRHVHPKSDVTCNNFVINIFQFQIFFQVSTCICIRCIAKQKNKE